MSKQCCCFLSEIEIEVVCSGGKIPQLDGGHDTSSSEDENFDDDDDHDDDDDEKEENEDGGGQEEVRQNTAESSLFHKVPKFWTPISFIFNTKIQIKRFYTMMLYLQMM